MFSVITLVVLLKLYALVHEPFWEVVQQFKTYHVRTGSDGCLTRPRYQ